ncbi:hypothetical protein ACP70R_008125 [Stipagrostis hirtigluma subsp. patula]
MEEAPLRLQKPRRDMEANTWASLLPDLLLEIFRHLEATAVVRCAAACKPWRRTIIGYASCLRPLPDRFVPDLLIGFFCTYRRCHVRLQRTPWPFQNQSSLVVTDDTTRCCGDAVSSLIPAGAGASVDLPSYDELLSSRDGLLLLRGSTVDDLCLDNDAYEDDPEDPDYEEGVEEDFEEAEEPEFDVNDEE